MAYLSIESSSVKAVLRLVCDIFVISFKNGVLLGWLHLGLENCTKKNYLPYLIRGRSQLSTFMKAYREYAFQCPPPYPKAYSKMLIFSVVIIRYKQHAPSKCTGTA